MPRRPQDNPKTIKYAIAYAEPTSLNAIKLGYQYAGCYYLQAQQLREDGEWSTPFIVPGTEGEACETRAPRLDDLLKEWQS